MKRIVVIGAGPAGSLAALLLARAGAKVTLIEQHRFPRDKVCGECLSSLGQQVLKRAGLGAIVSLGVPIKRAVLHGTTTRVGLDLPEPMLGLSRSAMDTALLAEAIKEGVTLRQPARAEAVTPVDGGVTIRVRTLDDNRVTEDLADLAIIADGRGNFLPSKPIPGGDFGVKAHFAGIAANADSVTLYSGRQGYGGVAPIEGGRWNVAFAVPRAALAAVKGDVDRWWATVLSDSKPLREDTRHARRLGPWLASPLPRHANVADWPNHVIPIGAAAWAIEPVGGEGMGTALRLAELAAAAVVSGDIRSLPAAFAAVMRQRSLVCRLGGWLMSGVNRSDLIALAGQPIVGDLAMRLIGK